MSALESILFAVVSAFIACILLIHRLSGQFVLKSECGLKHDGLAGLKAQQDLIFRMLRAVIVHLDIPKEEIERILNMNAADFFK